MTALADWPRIVGHLDMDAFYVSLELRRRPELRDRPVVVAGSGPRAVVTTASYEARRSGVGSAMPAARARRLCPEAVFLEPDFAYYRAASRELMEIVRAHLRRAIEASTKSSPSPAPARAHAGDDGGQARSRVEVVGLDEAYLELSGVGAPAATMRALREEIGRRLGLSCSVGIGPNKLVAKVASDAQKPAGFVVLTRAQACARFGGERCDLIPGIGPKTSERLRSLGIVTLAQLAAAPAQLLGRAFGARQGEALRRRARFEDDSPVSGERAALSESREVTFDRDVFSAAELEATLERLVGRLADALAAQGRRGRTVAIKIRLDDFSTHTRARTLPAPVDGAGQIGPVALELLRRFAPARPVRLLGVRVAALEPAAPDPVGQLTLTV